MESARVYYAAGGGLSPEEALEALEGRFRCSARRPIRGSSTYHDSFDWRLYRHGVVLESVPVGGRLLLRWLDVAGRLVHGRRVGEVPDFAAGLPDGPFRDRMGPWLGVRRLLPQVRVERRAEERAVLDERDKTVARVRVERSRVFSGGERRGRPSLRLCVEELTGYPGPFAEVLNALDGLGLRRDPLPPLESALEVLGRSIREESVRVRVELAPDEPTRHAVVRVFRALLAVIDRNEQGVRDDVDTEFLHDFRVAVRRTRSWQVQFKRAFGPGLDPFRRDLKWLGEITGPTRDLDVHVMELGADLPDELAPIVEGLAVQRASAQRLLARRLGSKRYRQVIEKWREFLDAEPDEVNDYGRRPIAETVAERIAALYAKLRRRARGSHVADPSTLHRTRIDAKKLRYLLELGGSVLEPKGRDEVVRELKKLQDRLGLFNDLEVQQQTLAGIAVEVGAPPDVLIATGRWCERLALRQADERRRAAKRLVRFASGPTAEAVARMTRVKVRR